MVCLAGMSISQPPLIAAVEADDAEAVRQLIASGSDPNQSATSGWPALLCAAMQASPALVRALLDAGADVNGRAADGSTALMKAAMWGRTEIVDVLIRYGADPRAIDAEGWTAAQVAAARGHADVAQMVHAAQREGDVMKPGSLGRLVSVALACSLGFATAAGAQPPPSPVRPVVDAPGQFMALKHHGEWLAFYTPNLDLSGASHWQGIQRFNGAGRPFLFVSASGNDSDDTRASLVIVEMGSRDSSGERLRSNRLRRGLAAEDTPPPNEDRVVGVIRFGDYEHAGGMQLMGNILAVPLEEKRKDDLPEGKVVFFDVSDPVHPQQIGELALDFKAGVVAMTDVIEGRVLLGVAGGNGRVIRFFRSNKPFGTPGFQFAPLGSWDGHALLENGLWPWQTDADLDPSPKLVSTHQMLNFVRQTDGRLFMIGAHNTHNHSPVIRGADVAVIYEVLNSGGDDPIRIREVEGLHFSCTADEAGRSCNFNAGIGMYVSPTGELIMYATEHYADGPNNTVQFAEYRHVDVFRPDSPRYLTSVDPGGPYVVDEGSATDLHGAGSPPSARAWVELYDDAPGGWRPERARMINPIGGAASWSFEDVGIDRSIMVDHGDVGRDDFDNLNALDDFNDKTSSVRWWAPPGCSIFLIENAPPGPRHLRLAHTPPGQAFITDLSQRAMCNAEGGDCVNAGDETSAIAFNLGCQVPQYGETEFNWGTTAPPVIGRLVNPLQADAVFEGIDGPSTQAVKLRVCVANAGCAEREVPITIRNVAPFIHSATVSPGAGGLARLQVSFGDASKVDAHQAKVEWGDNQSGDVLVTEADGKGTLDVTHTYAHPGTYQVDVTIVDDDGAQVFAKVVVKIEDEEPPVLTLPATITKEAAGPAGAHVAFSASASDNVDGNVPVMCVPGSGNEFALGATTVSCTAEDSSGNVASGSFMIAIVDTTPPALTLPATIVTEAAGPGGTAVSFIATAKDIVSGPLGVTCTPASGATFPIGPTTVLCKAVDAAGNVSHGSFDVRVVDTTAPVMDVTPGTDSLWPPNGRMVPVQFSISVSDVGDATPACSITSIMSNEPGHDSGDWMFSDLNATLRAERLGSGTGRIYTVTVACTDSAGNQSATEVTVGVPHDLGNGRNPSERKRGR